MGHFSNIMCRIFDGTFSRYILLHLRCYALRKQNNSTFYYSLLNEASEVGSTPLHPQYEIYKAISLER